MNSTSDIVYREDGSGRLALDIHHAADATAPVVIYVHGGGFLFGDKADDLSTRLRPLTAHGVTVASIDYRFVDAAPFPAPLEDVRAAVRFLRARGAEYGLDTSRLGIWGASAGGYLAAMAALRTDDPAAAVDAACIWFAPSDLLASSSRSPLEAEVLPFHFEADLLGVESVSAVSARAAQASPVNRVSADAPPFLLQHGDRDRLVLPEESESLHRALRRVGVSSTLTLLGGAGHEDPAFDTDANLAMVAAWFRSVLRDPVNRAVGTTAQLG